jgi:phage terminase small subunit
MSDKLTKKQKAFADKLIANPKMSATVAALETYGKPDKPTTYGTAGTIATQNLKEPKVLKYLNKHLDKAEITVLDVMQNSSQLKDEPAHAAIALKAADSVIDRLMGKATQRIEQQTNVVTLSLSLKDITEANR